MAVLVVQLTPVGQHLAALAVPRPDADLLLGGSPPTSDRTGGTGIEAGSALRGAHTPYPATLQIPGVDHSGRDATPIGQQELADVPKSLAVSVGQSAADPGTAGQAHRQQDAARGEGRPDNGYPGGGAGGYFGGGGITFPT